MAFCQNRGKHLFVLACLPREEWLSLIHIFLPVRKTISLWSKEEAETVTEEAMSLETEEEVRLFLQEHRK